MPSPSYARADNEMPRCAAASERGEEAAEQPSAIEGCSLRVGLREQRAEPLLTSRSEPTRASSACAPVASRTLVA